MSDLINLQGQPWTPGPLHPVIAGDELHVWRVSVDLDQSALLQCRYALNEEELARAADFRFDKDRNRWIAARGLFRVVVGRYLYREPRDIAFREPPLRKPTLVLTDNDFDLRFNISHSDGVALFAIGLGREVGVDVERIRADFDTAPVAAQVFSTAEIATLVSADVEDRNRCFFTNWTCKEAYVKTLGAGLSYPMTNLTVRVTESGNVEIEDKSVVADSAGHIAVQRLSVGPQYSAAVACVGEIRRLRCWHGPAGIPIGLWRPSDTRDRCAA